MSMQENEWFKIFETKFQNGMGRLVQNNDKDTLISEYWLSY